MVGNNSRNSANNDHLLQMMATFSARSAKGSGNPQPGGTVTAPSDADLEVSGDDTINIE